VARITKITIRSGTNTPNPADFDESEPAWDKANGRLYIKDQAGAMVSVGGSSGPIAETSQVISQDYTLSSGANGISLGPVEIANTFTVTIPANAAWAII